MPATTRIPRHRILTLHALVSGLLALALFLVAVGFGVFAVVRLF